MNARIFLLLLLACWLIGSAALFAHAQDRDLAPITPENAAQVTQLATLEQDWLADLAWAPDGETLAVAGSAGVWLYDPADLAAEPRLLAGHNGPVQSVAYSQYGAWLAFGGQDGTVQLWDVATGEPLAVLEGHTGPVLSLAFGPSDELASGGQDGTVRVWAILAGEGGIDGTTVERLVVLEGHRRGVYGLAYSPDGMVLASGSRDGTVRLWQLVVDSAGVLTRESQVVLTGKTGPVESVAYPASLEGGTGRVMLAAGGWRGVVQLWPLTDRDVVQEEGVVVLEGHNCRVRDIAYSPLLLEYPLPPSHATLLASAGHDGTVRLWDVIGPTQTSENLIALEGHTGAVVSVAFNPAGTMLASGGRDGTVRLWGVPE